MSPCAENERTRALFASLRDVADLLPIRFTLFLDVRRALGGSEFSDLHRAASITRSLAMIQLKRVYEKPSRKDGLRVLVDRLWPRGLTKERAAVDLWLKDVARRVLS